MGLDFALLRVEVEAAELAQEPVRCVELVGRREVSALLKQTRFAFVDGQQMDFCSVKSIGLFHCQSCWRSCICASCGELDSSKRFDRASCHSRTL